MTFIQLKKRLPKRPAAAPVLDWEPGLLDALVDALPRGKETLVLGLGPWGRAPGTLGLLKALQGRGKGLVAVDPDKARLAAGRGYCQRTLEGAADDPVLEKRLDGQRFDLVVAPDVLVGQADPKALLRQLRPLVAEEGRLFVVVPNAAFADARLALLAGDVPRGFEQAPAHLFTRRRLRELLAFAGFAVEAMTAYEQPLLAASGLVPALFSAELLAKLAPDDEARAAYYVVEARPAEPAGLLRQLFDEQEALAVAIRNDLAVAAREREGLERELKETAYTRDQLQAELEEARKKEAQLQDLMLRSEQNVRRLGKEADDLARELALIKGSFWFKLGQFFGRLPASEPVPQRVGAPGF